MLFNALTDWLNRMSGRGQKRLLPIQRSRRSARRASISSQRSAPAEVLEPRQLLTATAVVTTNAAGQHILNLTSSDEGDTVDVYRLNSTQIEIDGSDLTTINGKHSLLVNLKSVDGIVVNLGEYEFDAYTIQSKAGDPALNIGTLGIIFQGTQAIGDQLNVENNSSHSMTIQGNVTVQGMTNGSALNWTGGFSEIDSGLLIDNESTAGMTIDGSVSANENAGTNVNVNNTIRNGDYTGSGVNPTGPLVIDHSVTLSAQTVGQGQLHNMLMVYSTGGIAVSDGVTMNATTVSGTASNEISTFGEGLVHAATGSISIGQGVVQTIKSLNGNSQNDVDTTINEPPGGGNLSIGGGISQNITADGGSTSPMLDGENIVASGIGNFSLNGALSQAAFGLNLDSIQNYAAMTSTGNLKIGINGGGITQSTGLCLGVATNIVGAIDNRTIPGVPTNGQQNQSPPIGIFRVGNPADTSKADSVTQTAYGIPTNSVINNGVGLLSIHYGVTQNANEFQGNINNAVENNLIGTLQIGSGGVTVNNTAYGLNGSFGTSNATAIDVCDIGAMGKNNLTIGGRVSITTTNMLAAVFRVSNVTSNYGSGNLSMQGVAIENFGAIYASYESETVGTNGSMTIGNLGITVFDNAAVRYSEDQIETLGDSSPINVLSSVTVNDLGSGTNGFDIEATNEGAGTVTIHGNVEYDNHLNQTGSSDVSIFGGLEPLDILGSLFLDLANTNGVADAHGNFNTNNVQIGTQDAIDTTITGSMTMTGGNGPDRVAILGTAIDGAANINLKGNPNANAESPSDYDQLTIDGSSLSSLTVMMSGPRATLDINQDSLQPTIFSSLLDADLTGLDPVVNIAAGTGPDFAKVQFHNGADILGSLNSGGVLKYHVANVQGTISPTNFHVVEV